ncbi:TPA: hypothetical protein ACH3X3_000178 [Trebouxia sp. C0006]
MLHHTHPHPALGRCRANVCQVITGNSHVQAALLSFKVIELSSQKLYHLSNSSDASTSHAAATGMVQVRSVQNCTGSMTNFRPGTFKCVRALCYD